MSQTDLPVFSEIARFEPWVDAQASADSGTTLAGLGGLRKNSLNRAARLGFPTTRHEEWRYTSLEPLARLPFQVAPTGGIRTSLAPDALAPFFLGGEEARRLVFVDGVFAPDLSAPGAPLEGLRLGNLAQSTLSLAECLDRCAGSYENPMGALNTALFTDGAWIHLTRGTVVPEPIHLLFVTTRAEAGTVHHLRNLIVAEAQSQAGIFESYVSLKDGAYVTNTLTELSLGAGAQIEHGRLQSESLEAFHFGAAHARQEQGSRFHSHSFALGARLARNDLRTVLAGEGGYAMLNGLYVVQGSQLIDHHTVVDHAQPHCESHEYYHGILDGQGKGVFNGKIFVRPDAQKTDAKQTNRNLLLSSDAAIDTKPQLEIFADDVKCTHGATVGQMDEDAVFYLQSRGIGHEDARRLLIHAFATVAIQRVQMTGLQPELDRYVLAKLGR